MLFQIDAGAFWVTLWSLEMQFGDLRFVKLFPVYVVACLYMNQVCWKHNAVAALNTTVDIQTNF